MSEQIRVGLVGTGELGTHLGRGFRTVPDAAVEAVADVDPDSRDRAGETFGLADERRYDDHEAMLEDADLDAIVVATPHTLHYDQVVAALERGIHVLCEKPLVTDLDDARDLVARDDASDAVLMVGYQRHLHPAFRTIRESLAEQTGTVNYVAAEITQDWIAAQAGAWRSDPDLSGGGQLYDTGSHLLDAVLWTTGLVPETVNARMQFHDDAGRVDVQAALNVAFEGGAVASLAVSGDAPRHREHLHVWGDDGGVYADREEWAEPEVRFLDADGDVTRKFVSDRDRQSKPAAFVEAIREGTEPPATARDALTVTAVTEAAYESARTGRTVEIDTRLDG